MSAPRAPRSLFAAATLAAVAAPGVASAHLVVSGMGPLYDGVYHALISPEDLLPATVLGLYAGVSGPAHGRALLASLPLAWVAGGLAAMAGLALPSLAAALLTAGLLVGAGLLLAINARLPVAVVALAAALLGLARGLPDFEGVAFTAGHLASLAGAAAASVVAATLAATVALQFRQRWLVHVFRVGGSWLVAFGLLLAGWAIHGATLQS